MWQTIVGTNMATHWIHLLCVMTCAASHILLLDGWAVHMTTKSFATASQMFQNPHKFFTHQQYLLGDLAYECCSFLVSVYKKPQGSSIPHEQEMFNTALSKPCIGSEHAIGIWKGRFPWLHGIPMIMK